MEAPKPGHRNTAITELSLHPDNPRQGDIGAIIQSIEANGWVGSIVAQTSTGHVLAGNHRLQAAAHVGMKKVPVHWIDVDDDTARRILIADNRTSDLATYDDAYLADLVSSIATSEKGLLGTGWDGDDLDDLLASIDLDMPELEGERGEMLSSVDVSIAEPSIRPERNSVYRLGRHSLFVCDLAKGWPFWKDALDAEGVVFLPFAGPWIAIALKKDTTGVLVQPDQYVAGHIIDKWDSVNLSEPAERVL
jgi:hypothetical protein